MGTATKPTRDPRGGRPATQLANVTPPVYGLSEGGEGGDGQRPGDDRDGEVADPPGGDRRDDCRGDERPPRLLGAGRRDVEAGHRQGGERRGRGIAHEHLGPGRRGIRPQAEDERRTQQPRHGAGGDEDEQRVHRRAARTARPAPAPATIAIRTRTEDGTTVTVATAPATRAASRSVRLRSAGTSRPTKTQTGTEVVAADAGTTGPRSTPAVMTATHTTPMVMPAVIQ